MVVECTNLPPQVMSRNAAQTQVQRPLKLLIIVQHFLLNHIVNVQRPGLGLWPGGREPLPSRKE